jgi:tetratricopeptide (TPR) repeat protein
LNALAWSSLVLLGLVVAGVGAVSAVRRSRDVAAEKADAIALISRGKTDAAKPPLARWMALDPRSAEAHALSAQVALEDGDLGRVSSELNEARELGLAKPELERVHALVLTRLGRYAEAGPILMRALTRNPNDCPVLEAMSRIYLKNYRLHDAEELVDRWIQLQPDVARPYLWRAEIDRRIRVDTSIDLEADYRQALRCDPGLEVARFELAELLRRAHHGEEAAAQYEIYLKARPDDAKALAGAGQNAVELGRIDEGVELVDAALAADPDNTTALRARATVDMIRGDLEPALERLNRCVEVNPFDSEALYTRSMVRGRLGQTEGAKADREAVDRLKREQAELLAIRDKLMDSPDDDDLRSQAAAWMLAHGRADEALEWARAILANDPKHPGANRIMAEYHEGQPGGSGLANYYRLQGAGAN